MNYDVKLNSFLGAMLILLDLEHVMMREKELLKH